MKLVLCEDEEASRSLMQRRLDVWQRQSGQTVLPVVYSSAEEMLFKQEEWADADGLILDIELKQMNGMELARRIRKTNSHIPILFVTGFEQYVFEGYEVGAVSYLMKPVEDRRLYDALERMLEQSRKNAQVYVAEGREESVRVYLIDILYIESCGHYTRIHTMDGEVIESRQGISEAAAVLTRSSFLMPHRSYLVNIPHIAKITKKDVCMDNGDLVPIARGRWEEINRAYMAYYRPAFNVQRVSCGKGDTR